MSIYSFVNIVFNFDWSLRPHARPVWCVSVCWECTEPLPYDSIVCIRYIYTHCIYLIIVNIYFNLHVFAKYNICKHTSNEIERWIFAEINRRTYTQLTHTSPIVRNDIVYVETTNRIVAILDQRREWVRMASSCLKSVANDISRLSFCFFRMRRVSWRQTTIANVYSSIVIESVFFFANIDVLLATTIRYCPSRPRARLSWFSNAKTERLFFNRLRPHHHTTLLFSRSNRATAAR